LFPSHDQEEEIASWYRDFTFKVATYLHQKATWNYPVGSSETNILRLREKNILSSYYPSGKMYCERVFNHSTLKGTQMILDEDGEKVIETSWDLNDLKTRVVKPLKELIK